MPEAKSGSQPNIGRKSAYVARNHAALLRATQEVLANMGPKATIEDIAKHAQVSVSTIYKHFDTKDALFGEAFLAAMGDWKNYVDQLMSDVKDPLEALVIPARLLLRLSQSHELYAQLLKRNLGETLQFTSQLSSGLAADVKKLVKAKVLDMDNVEIRAQCFFASLFPAMSNQLMNPHAKISDADTAIEMALSILNISPAKAKKLARGKLPALSSQK